MTKVVIHQAGPLRSDKIQPCARCGAPLKDLRVRGVDMPSDAAGPLAFDGGSPYPTGAFIEVGPSWQAMTLERHIHATCEPAGQPGI